MSDVARPKYEEKMGTKKKKKKIAEQKNWIKAW